MPHPTSIKLRTKSRVLEVAFDDGQTKTLGEATKGAMLAYDPFQRPSFCLPRSGSTFGIGKTVVSCWASNKVGKIGRSTFTVTVTRPAF